ncbi:hypothetical protein V501_00130 [Pseudogymnoascus sp. VKM F-4519 (FW-2642)]|nr:hypothetical protein V501_00130 [Pseudogymnoascus sp. VKM F-4519 (FW-2642)]
MTNPPPSVDGASKKAPSRAKKACRTCNARRVRCNVMEERPCKNCKVGDIPCELMKSKRGNLQSIRRYSRHAGLRGSNETRTQPEQNELSQQNNGEDPGRVLHLGMSDYRVHELQCSTAEKIPTLEDGRSAKTGGSQPNFDAANFNAVPPSNGNSTTDIVNGVDNNDSTVYLGESNSISLVHGGQDLASPDQPSPNDKARLRYPIPDTVNAKMSAGPLEMQRREKRIAYLVQEGAFSFPSNEAREVLLHAYFSWFHPCFPIVDRKTLYKSYTTKTISPLLLQSLLFVGASHCSEETLRQHGYPNRHDARSTLYNYAKDIYDADYEKDKITVSQSLFLMSFWRSGPLLEKDTRHWLGSAISLAQTQGMHRSLSAINVSNKTLRKRIWWSIYVRDRQSSAALGLPTRIHDEDCDVEMLDLSDFEEQEDSPLPPYFGQQKLEHVLYAIEIVKLAKLLGKICQKEFAPRDGPNVDLERSKLRDDLLNWEAQLSLELKPNPTSDSSLGFWVGSLHLAYNNLFILLYRSAYVAAQDVQDGNETGERALQAACRNTRIIEDILSKDLVQYGNVHLITSLFNSLCIHTIHLRRSQNTARKLAEYRAQICLLGLRELQRTWDVTNWVLQLFFQFLDNSTAEILQLVDHEDSPNQSTATDGPEPEQSSFNSMLQTAAFAQTPSSSDGYGMDGADRDRSRGLNLGLAFASQLFGTKEAEDFSMLQLQPDLLNCDIFGGALDQYHNSIMPQWHSAVDMNDGTVSQIPF